MNDEHRMSGKLDLAARSFQTVLRHVEHEDNKATRIVISMAFLTAAAAAVFSQVEGDPDPIATVAGEDINMTILMFAVFAGFVLGGTLFMLAALGPKFNLPRHWREEESADQPEEPEVDSLLFSERIARYSEERWRKHWESSTDYLTKQMERNLVHEAHLLAGKAVYKVEMMRLGRNLYRLALMALAWFLAVSFSDGLDLGLPVGGLGSALILVQAGLETGLEPAGANKRVLSEGLSTPRGALGIALVVVGIIGVATSTGFIFVTY